MFDDVRTVRGEAAADAGRGGPGAATREPDAGRAGGASTARPDNGREAIRGLSGCAARVDLIAGGFPCRGVSSAGKREGFDNAETVLWHEMRRVIGEVQPRYVLIENVSAILGMAASPGEPAGSMWGTVLADLAEIGPCHIVWDCIPAGACGAPHLRDRLFAVATYPGHDERRADKARGDHARAHSAARGRPEGSDQHRAGGEDAANAERQPFKLRRGPGPVGSTPSSGGREARQQRARSSAADRDQAGVAVEWGDYQPAITRWEHIRGPAPAPLVTRVRGVDARRAGRVDRSRLSALGDGVCVHVAYLVGEYVMSLERARLADAARVAA